MNALYYGLVFWSELTKGVCSFVESKVTYGPGFPLLPNSVAHAVKSADELRVTVILKEVKGDASRAATTVT